MNHIYVIEEEYDYESETHIGFASTLEIAKQMLHDFFFSRYSDNEYCSYKYHKLEISDFFDYESTTWNKNLCGSTKEHFETEIEKIKQKRIQQRESEEFIIMLGSVDCYHNNGYISSNEHNFIIWKAPVNILEEKYYE